MMLIMVLAPIGIVYKYLDTKKKIEKTESIGWSVDEVHLIMIIL